MSIDTCSSARKKRILQAVAKRRFVTVTVDVTDLPSLGGKARAATLSAEQLSDAGRKAVKARWDAYYKLHPEKLKAKLAKKKKPPK